MSVVGARPQFVKLAPVAEAMGRVPGCSHLIVHTGQHYDVRMSDTFFADLAIPAPDVHLGVGSGSHGAQTGAMLVGLEEVLVDRRPDWVLVYGDTNSTLAAAVAAVKLGLPVAHLEAGLRSFNRRMPEEHNRVLTDHAADLLLAPTEVAMGHLGREGLAERARLVGDVMTDVCLRTRDGVLGRGLDIRAELGLPEGGTPFILATIHRAENTDDPARLRDVLDALARLPWTVVLPAHPRLVQRCKEFGLALHTGALHVVPPLAYPETIAAILEAQSVVTDSGGLQKEAYLLGTPCTTLRSETEWTETLNGDWNVVLGSLAGLEEVTTRPAPTAERGSPFGDGRAADRTVAAIADADGIESLLPAQSAAR